MGISTQTSYGVLSLDRLGYPSETGVSAINVVVVVVMSDSVYRVPNDPDSAAILVRIGGWESSFSSSFLSTRRRESSFRGSPLSVRTPSRLSFLPAVSFRIKGPTLSLSPGGWQGHPTFLFFYIPYAFCSARARVRLVGGGALGPLPPPTSRRLNGIGFRPIKPPGGRGGRLRSGSEPLSSPPRPGVDPSAPLRIFSRQQRRLLFILRLPFPSALLKKCDYKTDEKTAF